VACGLPGHGHAWGRNGWLALSGSSGGEDVHTWSRFCHLCRLQHPPFSPTCHPNANTPTTPAQVKFAHAHPSNHITHITHTQHDDNVPIQLLTSPLRGERAHERAGAMAESGSGGDILTDLTTAPIFDPAVYLFEALGLPEGQNEDDVEAHLSISARESGIEDPYRFLCPDLHDISTSISTLTVASESRSSMSMHSRETQSTGITSHPSRTSRDIPFMESTPALRMQLTPTTPTTPTFSSRGSTSFDCYDTVLDRHRPSVRHRPSSSQFSNPRTHSALSSSALSSSYALAKPARRKHKRKSGLFSIFRKDDG
jgi:hypothetical protein